MEVKGQVHTPVAFLCKRGTEEGLNRSTVRSKIQPNAKDILEKSIASKGKQTDREM